MRRRATIWRAADGLHVDVRGLAPPEPLVAILEQVDSGTDPVIIVHHERDPVMLYEQLAARGWRCATIDGDPGELRLRLERESC